MTEADGSKRTVTLLRAFWTTASTARGSEWSLSQVKTLFSNARLAAVFSSN
jgi:hypothetical protein